VLVIGSQNCPFTQLSGSAEPIPALNSDTAAMGAAAAAAMVERRRRLRMNESCPKARVLKRRKAQARDISLTWASSVEPPGIEPGSNGIPSRLLRAQFAKSLLGSLGLANKP
jgi:hypothetical protein